MPKSEKIRLFYRLIVDEVDCKPIFYYTSKLSVTTKTIYNYMKELEYEISHFDLQIERKREGIQLLGNDKERQRFRQYLDNEVVSNDYTEKRRKELLEYLLMRDKKVSVRKLEEKYEVAKSSIVNDLEYVDKLLQKNGLFLVRDKSGTYASGKEQHIRSAKRNYVYEQFKEKISSKESYDMRTCRDIVARYVHEKNLLIAQEMIDFVTTKLSCELSDDTYYYQIFIQFAIFLDRIEKEHFLVSTTYRPVVSELHNLKTYPVTVELSQWIFKKHGIQLKDQDVRWLNARVSGVYHENTLHRATDKTEEANGLLLEFVETISMVVGENLLEDEVLMKGLQQHIVPMISRITNKIKITNPFLPQIKGQYPALFSVLGLASTTFENSLGVHLSDDEISFILLHVQASIEHLNLSKKIAIVIHSSGASAAFVENRVKRNLPRFDVVETFNYDDMLVSYLDEFDFIISTVQIDYQKKPVILISPIVDEYDVRKINRIYHDAEVQAKENSKNLLLETLDDHSIFMHQEYETSQQVLMEINRVLKVYSYVNDGFLDSMLAREKISPTEMGNGIAIPHGISKYVLREKIVVMTLRKPIIWEKEKVDIIFCLAFNFKDKERSRKLISNIYRIIKSREAVEKIRLCETRDEFF